MEFKSGDRVQHIESGDKGIVIDVDDRLNKSTLVTWDNLPNKVKPHNPSELTLEVKEPLNTANNSEKYEKITPDNSSKPTNNNNTPKDPPKKIKGKDSGKLLNSIVKAFIKSATTNRNTYKWK